MFSNIQKMKLLRDIQSLEKEMDQIQSVGELRYSLSKKGLRFIVIILSERFNCFEWNITQTKVSKVLDLELRVRISRISDESVSFETVHSEPIRLKDPKWTNPNQFFDILKQAISKSLKRIEMFKDDQLSK